MKTRFVACHACARHVRAADARCPFCGASAPEARPVRTIAGRLSRAALHAAGAAGAVVAIGDCGGSETRSTAFYGAACIDGSCSVMTDSGADAGDASDANIGVFYGAPCIDGSCLPPGDEGGNDAAPEAGADVVDGGASDGSGGD